MEKKKEKTSKLFMIFCLMLLLSSLLLLKILIYPEKYFWRFSSDSRWALCWSLLQKTQTMFNCCAGVLAHQFRGITEVSTGSFWKLKNTLLLPLRNILQYFEEMMVTLFCTNSYWPSLDAMCLLCSIYFSPLLYVWVEIEIAVFQQEIILHSCLD